MFVSRLFEGISPILFHRTNLPSIQKIIIDGQYNLSISTGTPAERYLEVEGKPFFLSTMRSLSGTYNRNISNFTSLDGYLVLDGRSLMQAGYTGKAVDYWGPKWRQGADPTNEMEDRIYSKKPTIPTIPHTLECHIFLRNTTTKLSERDKKDILSVVDIYRATQDSTIQLYVYDNLKAYQTRQRKLAVDNPLTLIKRYRAMVQGRDKDWFNEPRNPFSEYVELFMKDEIEKLSKKTKKFLYDVFYYEYDNYGVERLKADLHNYRKGDTHQWKYASRFVQLMQKNDLSSAMDVIEYIKRKFKEQYENR